ncbi:helix-turn-helix domain-containing protein [Marinicella meishanensis]|uniref:helix-turn-helix domain-containing protein n=1 Tax=Marinicella meishanensis TaxID=2873263 RepID=UPI001CBF8A40|nr:helix-turn-helix domain-containing protein [Marinicella sp. NBU2979]
MSIFNDGPCYPDNTTSPPNNPPPSGGDIERIINSRISQRRKILRILKTIGHISSEQMRDLGFFSGPKRISELKELGYVIYRTQDWERNGLATYWYKGHKGDANG